MEGSEKLYTINRLKTDFGMKPKIDANPAAWWRNRYKKDKYPVYRLSDCEKLPAKKALSDKQTRAIKMLQVNRHLAGYDKEYSNVISISKTVQNLFDARYVVLDTETTGLDDKSQIIELAIIDHNGVVLHNARYKPTVNISDRAYQVHGISLDMLKNEKTIAVDADKIKNILINNTVVIFNSSFDLRLLEQTFHAFKIETDYISSINSFCAMNASARCYGSTNCYGSISLADSFYEAGGKREDWISHNALGDCQATLFVLNDIKDKQNFINSEREKLKIRLMEQNGL
ncbi:3'-5' exonuclease [Methylomonas montana]|uniref:3'-5' exonuclease n=1 Tax=Methylomonas montana TaxID=3058963 RepID=UPI00265B1A7D|nr:3'-5' exonuclease [Methylomonas montana]WKJ88596.1 3'-5' exonuclease [Methylomonas montana]